MSVAFRAQKKIVAIWSIFSIFLNIAQPAFLALALAPMIAPSSVKAEDVVLESTPEPSVTPTVAPSETPVIVELPAPTSEPTIAPLASVAPSDIPLPSPTPEATITPTDSPVPSVLPSPTPDATPNTDAPSSPLPVTESSPAPPIVESPTPTPTTSSAPISEPTFKEELQISILDNTIASSIEAVDLTVTETGSAVLATDKLDYAPTDTALIIGVGFLPNTGYTLVISSTDEPATSTSQSVTSDENGKIFYAYQLDGTYRPNYKVEALLGSILVATITFTDHSNTHVSINGGDSSTTSLDVVLNITWGGSGSVPAISRYANVSSASSCPNSSSSSWSAWETYTSLKNWTLSAGGSGTRKVCIETAHGTPSSHYGTENDDDTISYTNTPVFRTLRIVSNITNDNGGTKTHSDFAFSINGGSAQGFELDGSNDIAANSGTYTITSPTVYGYSVSYSNCSGITVPANTVVTCTISHNDIQPQFTLTKVVTNDNGGTKVVSDFPLSVGSTSVTSGVSHGFNAGTYAVSESGAAGYSVTITGSDCNIFGQVSLSVGDVKSCTITNNDIPGTLVVRKVIVGGTKTANQFTFSVNGASTIPFESDGQNDVSVNAGSYYVTEPTDSLYTTTYSGCGTSNNRISIGLGETKTCTITNTRKTGRILIDKILFEGPAVQSDWTFTIGGIDGSWVDGQIATLNTGSYSITESGNVLGYSLSAVGGACSTISSGNSATLNVTETDNNHSNTCSFTNTRDKGNVRVNKQVDLNGDGDYYDHDEQSNHEANHLGFRWSLDNGDNNDMGDTESNIPTSIAGSVDHYLSENHVAGYHLVGYSTNGSCTNPLTTYPIPVTVSKNTTTTITLCNARDKGTITIIKDAKPNNSQNFHFTGDLGSFDLDDDGSNSTHNHGLKNSATFNVVSGSYTINENKNEDWKLTDLRCDDDSVHIDQSHARVTINLSQGDDITCTFENTKLAKIEGIKFNDRDGDGRKDYGEYGIKDWRINLGDRFDYTDHHGEYSFSNLLPGDYQICEEDRDGWYHVGESCKYVTLSAGENEHADFGNYQNAVVTIIKDVVDADGHATLDDSTGFEFDLSGQENNFTLYDGDGGRTFSVMPGSYTLDEVNRSVNYDFAGCSISGTDHDHDSDHDDDEDEDEHDDDSSRHSQSSHDLRFTVRGGDEFTIVCKNKQKTGNLVVTKYNDINGNGSRDESEPTLDGWQINLSGQESRSTNEGSVTFTDLLADWYSLSETDQEGWTQTSISCNDNQETLTRLSEDVGHSVYVEAGQTTQCEIGNQQEPVLMIQKSNNASGNKNPGDIVIFTLVVDLSRSDLDDVRVTDVPADGFTYVGGSWTATKNGEPLSIVEPSYGSPAVWLLGNMLAGDTITLTYKAKISADQDGGTYRDVAFAEGDSLGWDRIMARGHNSTYVDEVFVGTDITVNKSVEQTGSVNIEREGQVLGASISQLPATGAETGWLLLALGALITGLLLIFGGKRMQKLFVGALVLSISLGIGHTGRVYAVESSNTLSVRIEQPTTPIRTNEWKLSYSVLDINNGTPVVSCYVKKPGTSSYIGFGSSHTSVKPSGDSANCQVNSSVMSDQGSYEFYVIATTSSSSRESAHVSVIYDSNGPGMPTSFSKENPSFCHWVIKFHTADDNGATTKVDIFSSDNKNFNTDNGTRVGTVYIGSNQDGVFNHDRADGCDKEWYYVIRAFDSAGNQSGHLGDEITGATTVATASPTTAALITTSANGSVLGKTESKVNEDGKGDILGEEENTQVPESVEGQGLVATAQGVVQKAVKSKSFWWVLIAISAIGIVYGISRKKITK